jgi:hypothetical protein
MAWLLHPDDFAALKGGIAAITRQSHAGLRVNGSIEVQPFMAIERGHIVDSEHPELGMPTFEEFGQRYGEVLERERLEFSTTIRTLERLTSGTESDAYKMGLAAASSFDQIKSDAIAEGVSVYVPVIFPLPSNLPKRPCAQVHIDGAPDDGYIVTCLADAARLPWIRNDELKHLACAFFRSSAPIKLVNGPPIFPELEPFP